MASKRVRDKTANITLRVKPGVKAAAELAAKRDHRSLTGFIELLILKHCEELNIGEPPTIPEREEP
jgi:hypothetical protein